jgi:hypothetical protein
MQNELVETRHQVATLEPILSSGAEPHFGLGGPGPPSQRIPPQKKKKNLKKKINFYPYFKKFIVLALQIILFSIWLPQNLKVGSTPDCLNLPLSLLVPSN